MKKCFAAFVLVAVVMIQMSGCAHHRPIHTEETISVYAPEESTALLHRYAPRFVVYEWDKEYNRIGRPAARFDNNGKEKIFIDSGDPAIFYMIREFEGERGRYTNLIYRVHFSGIPFSLIPFHLTAGKNVGLMVVVTLNELQQPVLITTVHTCGCYIAIVPTTALPETAYPENRESGPLSVFGETLPNRVDFRSVPDPVLLVHLRPQVHRVMDLKVADAASIRWGENEYRLIPTVLEPVEYLNQIPLGEATTSLYHDQGGLRGHVKGSVKGWETLLLSIISLDLYVGTDKVYADPEESGNPFYTSLKPWNRNASNMWHFIDFLAFWGWRL